MKNNVYAGEVTDKECLIRGAKFKAIMKGTYRVSILSPGTGGSF